MKALHWLAVLVNNSDTFSSSGVVTNDGKFERAMVERRLQEIATSFAFVRFAQAY